MKKTSIKVFGIGGAGCNALGFMAGEQSGLASLIALNTDEQSLSASAAPLKFCLGARMTYGMGTGGDPELGRSVAEADVDQIREFCEGANIVFIVAGLGGGTGTGAASVVARAAKDAGAHVLGLVTLPFDFEGGRRHRQANLGLQQLKAIADAVICLPNEKVFKLIDEKTTVLHTFELTNGLLAQAISGISRLLTQTGLINVDFADFCCVTRNLQAESSFATAEAAGENRAQQIISNLFSHPMLEKGELLVHSETLLVSLVGGPDLTMVEVNLVMKAIHEQCEHAHVIFGAAIDEAFANRLSVTLIASGKVAREEANPLSGREVSRKSVAMRSDYDQLLHSNDASRPASRVVAPAPELTPERKAELLTRQTGSRTKKSGARMRQNELPLEIISKGRFEKSEPTIHRGEDLDLPTYLRRGIPLN